MDFSTFSPQTIAIGLSNGCIQIYDTRRTAWEVPIQTSDGIAGGHENAVR
jgi:hypothetical protein